MTTSLSHIFVNKFYSITDSLHIFYEMESIMSGQLKTMDGNMAAAYVSYAFTETAAIYPKHHHHQWRIIQVYGL